VPELLHDGPDPVKENTWIFGDNYRHFHPSADAVVYIDTTSCYGSVIAEVLFLPTVYYYILDFSHLQKHLSLVHVHQKRNFGPIVAAFYRLSCHPARGIRTFKGIRMHCIASTLHIYTQRPFYSHYTGHRVSWHPQLRTGGFFGAKFYCPHALADDS